MPPLDLLMEAALPRGHGELVLVIDDETALRTIIQLVLESFGYRVLLAESGTKALVLYAQHEAEIAVVLTDIMMPGMDGFATTEMLLAINPHVKVIAASGLASADIVTQAMRAGVKGFIPKPYIIETLLKLFAAVLADSEDSAH
jgi:CheY-like chemotaxis protein